MPVRCGRHRLDRRSPALPQVADVEGDERVSRNPERRTHGGTVHGPEARRESLEVDAVIDDRHAFVAAVRFAKVSGDAFRDGDDVRLLRTTEQHAFESIHERGEDVFGGPNLIGRMSARFVPCGVADVRHDDVRAATDQPLCVDDVEAAANGHGRRQRK